MLTAPSLPSISQPRLPIAPDSQSPSRCHRRLIPSTLSPRNPTTGRDPPLSVSARPLKTWQRKSIGEPPRCYWSPPFAIVTAWPRLLPRLPMPLTGDPLDVGARRKPHRTLVGRSICCHCCFPRPDPINPARRAFRLGQRRFWPSPRVQTCTG